ncbi:MAG TPA: heme peroxidase family protein [Solirubrobacterales bacterium]|nr:heme peroxidase family protein [Solirubrobacterales bacterium]
MLDAHTTTATAVKTARDHCLAPSRTIDAPLEGASGRYERLFPDLEPLAGDEARLLAFGVPGGVCDGGPSCEDARETAAGWPFFGQFVAHDITADRSELAHHADGKHLLNFRTPRANLECLYGAGPVGNPFLYSRDDPAKLLVGRNEAGEEADLPRNQDGIALVGDPRNDVHLFMAQLHVAMLRMHNGLVDRLRANGVADGEVFDRARREASWHYQWIIVEDYLPTLAGRELVDEIRSDGSRFYRVDGSPRIPLEFADGAFRYGHSQIREDYVLNDGSGEHRLFPDLLGFGPVPASRTIDWTLFFDVAGRPPAQRAKLIDGKLARSLIELPTAITGESEEHAYHSLAGRDLQRGRAYGLPSGESVARAMGEEPLSRAEVGLADFGWEAESPLWFYVLRESEARADGERLGPVGGRIVAEVLLGIIDGDPESYRAVEPDWTPTLPYRGDRFELTDVLLPVE